MKAIVYKQAYDAEICTLELTPEEIESGFSKRPCGECQGTGLFIMPDEEKVTCNACKGQGFRWVTLWLIIG